MKKQAIAVLLFVTAPTLAAANCATPGTEDVYAKNNYEIIPNVAKIEKNKRVLRACQYRTKDGGLPGKRTVELSIFCDKGWTMTSWGYSDNTDPPFTGGEAPISASPSPKAGGGDVYWYRWRQRNKGDSVDINLWAICTKM